MNRVGHAWVVVLSFALVLTRALAGGEGAQASGGTSWTLRSAPNAYWAGVTFADGRFVVVPSGGSSVLTSPDGVTWTSHSAPIGTWTSIVHAQGQFVAVGANDISGNRAMTSPDGFTWTVRPGLNVATNWLSVAFGDDTYVASGAQWMAYSTDGIAWTEVNTDGSYHAWSSVAFGDDTFVTVNSHTGGGTNRVMTSNDGVTWTPRNAGIDANEWQSVVYGAGRFVAVAGTGTNRVMTSPDGVTWTPRSAASADYWRSVTYGGGQFVAVGHSGAVMTSPDGITWTSQASGNAAVWRAVTAGPQYVAVGQTDDTPIMSSFIYAAPTLTSVSPPSGPVAGGISLTLTGTGFRSGAEVTIGGSVCGSMSVVDDSTITCISPSGTAGSRDVVITNVDSQDDSLPAGFAYVAPPEPPSPLVPADPPTAVLATAGVSSASVAWHAPTSSGTYPITNYHVQATPGGQACVVSAPSLGCEIAGLSGGTPYTFAARALTGAGWGPWSSPSNPVTPLAPASKSIVITGSRDTTDRRVISVSGATTGLVGERVTPWVKFAGQAEFAAGAGTRTVGSDGTFTWARKSSKKTYVYFAGGGVSSNRVIIDAR